MGLRSTLLTQQTMGCHHKHLLHITTHNISFRAVTAVDSMKKSGRFEWQEFFQHPSLYYLQFFSSNHYLFSWPELSLSKCSEFNSENPVVRELDLVAALKVFINMRAMINRQGPRFSIRMIVWIFCSDTLWWWWVFLLFQLLSNEKDWGDK